MHPKQTKTKERRRQLRGVGREVEKPYTHTHTPHKFLLRFVRDTQVNGLDPELLLAQNFLLCAKQGKKKIITTTAEKGV